MEEPLRVLVRVDTKDAAASVEVRGALTRSNYGTLLNILRHTATLGASICINLTRAVSIESGALAVLSASVQDLECSVKILPAPAGDAAATDPAPRVPLDNDRALEMILHRDPGVLAGADRAGTARHPRTLPPRTS